MDKGTIIEACFRAILFAMATIVLLGGVHAFESGSISWALFDFAAGCGMLASANILDPSKRVDARQALAGRVSWSMTDVGFMLQLAAALLFVLWAASLVT